MTKIARKLASVVTVLGWLIISFSASTAAAQQFSGQSPYQPPRASASRWTSLQEIDPPAPTDSSQDLLKRLERLESLIGEEGGEGESVVADDESKEEEDEEESLADQVKELEDTLPQLVYHSHKKPKMQIFGRIHLDYWAFPGVDEEIFPLEAGGNPQDRIIFRRLRVGVKGDINDNMFYKYEGEFAGGVEPSYRDAYLGFKDLPWFNTVIIGNHKRPYGYDHLNSSRYNIFIERPFVIEAFNQDSRRLGISSNGFSEDLLFNWRYGVWNQRLTQVLDGYVGDHYQLEAAGRLAMTPIYDEACEGRTYLHLAIAGSVGTPDGTGPGNEARYRTRPEARSNSRWYDTGRIAGADINSLAGLEMVYNRGGFQFAGEYQAVNVDRAAGFGPNVQFHGGYVEAAWFLTPGDYMPWDREQGVLARIKPTTNFFVKDEDGCRQRGWGAWQVALRYSHADLSDEDVIGGKGDSYTLGLNWYWNPYARLQFNYILGDLDQGRDNLGQGNYDIVGMRAMVDF